MGNGFVIAACLCIVGGFGLDYLKIPLQWKRRAYWGLTVLAAIFVTLGAHTDFTMLVSLLFVVLLTMVGSAYAFTPYIRIRGRIYAFQPIHINAGSEGASAQLQRHEQIATPPKIWWIIAGFWLAFDVAVCSSFLPGRERFSFQHDRDLLGYMLGFCLLSGIGFGFGEAKCHYPVAQGQRLQFIIASISSAGLFAVLYLTSYRLTTRTIARCRS